MVEKECSVVHTDKIEKVFSEITDDLSLAYMAEIFQCFADPTRLKIINALLTLTAGKLPRMLTAQSICPGTPPLQRSSLIT